MNMAASTHVRNGHVSTPLGPTGRLVVGGAGLLLAALLIYGPVLRGDWLWDDAAEITQNPEVTGEGGLAAIWLAPSHMDYFPLKTTVQWFAWRLWKDQVVGYHLLNVALHVLSGLLVWRLLAKLGLGAAWLGGLLFVVHPLAVESVAWIAELKNTVSLPPLLLAACAYVDFAQTGRRARSMTALVWFLASLLCKTSGVMLPVVLLLYHFWSGRRITLANVIATAPFFLIAVILGLVTIHFQHARAIADTALPVGGIGSRLAVAGLALWFYAGKFFLPLNLVPIYRPWTFEPLRVLDFLPWVILAGVAFWCWHRRAGWGRHVLFGAGAFAVLVAPVLGLVPMSYVRYSWVADHFVYLPILGLIGLTVGGIDWLRRAWRSRTGVAAVTVALVAFLIVASRQHAGRFRDEESMWTYTLRHNPKAWVAHDGLGRVRQARGRVEDAAAHFQAAIDGDAQFASPRNNLARLWLDQGRVAEAIPLLEAALQIDSKFAAARSNLGSALLRLGRTDEAIAQFREALRVNPTLGEARNNLGHALFRSGRIDDAVTELRRAIAEQPAYAEAYNNLGKIFIRTKRVPEALELQARATQLTPANAGYRYDYGYALIVTGRMQEAAVQLREALRLKPDYADAHTNLAGVLYQSGDLDGAIAHYEAALRLEPNAAEARQNLALIRQQKESPRVQPVP